MLTFRTSIYPGRLLASCGKKKKKWSLNVCLSVCELANFEAFDVGQMKNNFT